MNDVMEINMSVSTGSEEIAASPSKSDTDVDMEINGGDQILNIDLTQDGDIDIDLDSNEQVIDINIEEASGKSKKIFTTDVYFKEDTEAAGDYTQVGNFNKGMKDAVTIETKDKTLDDFIRLIFTKELQPTKTDPSVNLTFAQTGSYEVGTVLTPSYSANLNPGSYTYGPPTGVTATDWIVEDSNGNLSSSSSGTFADITVGDSTDYTITAKAKHTAGAIALTNLGNESIPEVKIAEGTKSKKSSSVTGYRAFFYAAIDTDSSVILNSDDIRSMTNGGKYASQITFTIRANSTANPKRIIIAIAHNIARIGLKQVLLASAFDTDITEQYKKTENAVNVEGKDGYFSVPYDIYVYEPAKIDIGEIHTVTLG